MANKYTPVTCYIVFYILLLDCVFTGNFVGVCSIGLGVQKHFTKFKGVQAPKRLRNTVLGNHFMFL